MFASRVSFDERRMTIEPGDVSGDRVSIRWRRFLFYVRLERPDASAKKFPANGKFFDTRRGGAALPAGDHEPEYHLEPRRTRQKTRP
jgi:hypothetical protein